LKWIVLGEDGGKIKLISDRAATGLLPKGSFLTVEKATARFVLRVEDSQQTEPFSPSPLIADMDLGPLKADQECRNVLAAYRICDLDPRPDGFIDFIPPQVPARRATQEEIDRAIGSSLKGPKVFIATIYANQNQILRDDDGSPITASLPPEMFFHQILVCGRTGSGKTVAAKYLAHHFVEKFGGAVLAVNVKDVDFLRMNRPSTTSNPAVSEEWNSLGEIPRGVENFTVYNPPTVRISPSQDVDNEVCRQVTLDVNSVDPEALTGLLAGVTDIGAQSLPGIFRAWQERLGDDGKGKQSFAQFVNYFSKAEVDGRVFQVTNSRGDVSEITLHKGTYDNVLRNLTYATDFFDNPDSLRIDESDILVPGKLSVLNVAGGRGIQFGSVFLRDILHRIVEAKSMGRTKIPVLIIIDEVHQFYDSDSSRDALGDLDTICRTGRSLEIGVLFSSQTPSDIPRGLGNVINTRIFFKTDSGSAKQLGSDLSTDELEGLRSGFAIASVHDLPSIHIMKFPLSLSGVVGG
jgi:uncharacterized protein